MNIPDKAVEAAARAIQHHNWPDLEDRAHHPLKDYMGDARQALEASAPYIAAQALRDEAGTNGWEWQDGRGYDYTTYGRRLRKRADQIEDELDPQ